MTLYSVTLKEAEPSKTVTDDGKELSVMDLDQDLLWHTVQGSWHRNPISWHAHICDIHPLVYMDTRNEDDRIVSSLSLYLAALFQVCLQVCVCVCFSTHICAHLQACMCLLCPISRHQVVTPSPTLGNTTVSFTIKAPFCLFDLFGYRLSLLYKSLLAFFLFSLCLFTPACRYFWRSFLKQRTMLNVEGITTSESFCFCFFKQKKTKKEKEVKVKKKNNIGGGLLDLPCHLHWGGVEQPKGNPFS